MAIAIQLDHVTKRYRAGRSRTLVDMVGGERRRPARPETADVHSATRGKVSSTIAALDDVTFEVSQGAGLGIIGRNGAGKTTLLKLISRVTWPTSGKVRVAGRTVSLIELGAGFHPELTGRENVYLGGGLFGLTRKEIDRQFDAIVDFAGRRAVDRHADEALFVGAVCAAWICGRDLQPARHRAGRRSAVGRRRGVQAARARGAARPDHRRQDGVVHFARHVERPPPVQRHPVDGERQGARLWRPPARSPSAT